MRNAFPCTKKPIPFLLEDAEMPENIPDGTEHKPIDDERTG